MGKVLWVLRILMQTFYQSSPKLYLWMCRKAGLCVSLGTWVGQCTGATHMHSPLYPRPQQPLAFPKQALLLSPLFISKMFGYLCQSIWPFPSQFCGDRSSVHELKIILWKQLWTFSCKKPIEIKSSGKRSMLQALPFSPALTRHRILLHMPLWNMSSQIWIVLHRVFSYTSFWKTGQ